MVDWPGTLEDNNEALEPLLMSGGGGGRRVDPKVAFEEGSRGASSKSTTTVCTDIYSSSLHTTDADEQCDRGDPEQDAEENAPRARPKPAAIAKMAGVAATSGLAIASFGAGLSASVAASTTAMTALGLAGGVCLVMSPFVLQSEWRLAHVPALRRRVNDMKRTAKDLKETLDLLRLEREELEIETERLHDVYDTLQKLVKDTNAGNIDELLELFRENLHILGQMKAYLRETIIQDVVRTVLRCDINRDGHFSKREMTLLESSLMCSLKPHGVVFDRDKFRRAVGPCPSLNCVVTIVRILIPEWDGNKLTGKASSFLDEGSDSDGTGDDDEEESNDNEETWDMFYMPLEEQCARGCVESIKLRKEYEERRGERPDLVSIASLGMSRSIQVIRHLGLNLDEMRKFIL